MVENLQIRATDSQLTFGSCLVVTSDLHMHKGTVGKAQFVRPPLRFPLHLNGILYLNDRWPCQLPQQFHISCVSAASDKPVKRHKHWLRSRGLGQSYVFLSAYINNYLLHMANDIIGNFTSFYFKKKFFCTYKGKN